MPTPEPVPFTLITGFLGAGKTSYLNQLIRQGLPRDSLIVVNDFGDINIDAELIEYRDEQILSLGNGCICCTLGGTLAEQLAQAMRMEPRPAAIYIEASGVAEPARIADIARTSRQLQLASVICLVDGSQIDKHATDRYTAEVWRSQIAGASQVVVNRLPAAPAHALGILESINPEALLNTSGNAGARQAPALRPVSRHADAAWRAVSLSYGSAIDAGRLEQLLRAYDDVVLRAKGILARTDHQAPQVFQLSGGVSRWLPVRRQPVANQLVCIGIRGARFDALASELAQLESASPANASVARAI
ncbi:CobW family GTP-binding protein [Pseudomonas segetis]|uniref:GTPase, G3E family n=1 Tax=Pseudomonas segetis TaxID=298908 RepID=A0A239CFT2_9PSED|nr:GTP-binding protein [Pseudomonas segetis]SNS18324.1 GTPase, G3E family [Pseudomonas segetis]